MSADEQVDAAPLPQAPHRDGSFGAALLNGLGAHRKHVYGGTVDPEDVRDRRRRNRAARAARRITRRRAR